MILIMPKLSGMGKNAGSLLAILSLVGVVSAWTIGLIPSYVLSDEFEQHVSKSVERVRFNLEDKILIIEDELDVYEAMQADTPLTARDRLKQSQLINRKQRYLRQLNANPR
jgi:hypothetical protein